MNREQIEEWMRRPNHALNGMDVNTFRALCDLALSALQPQGEPVAYMIWGPMSGPAQFTTDPSAPAKTARRADYVCTPLYAAPPAAVPQGEPVDIVFDGPPSHEAPRFVEVESPPGKSIRFGKWLQRDDGYWVLRLNAPPADGVVVPREGK